MNVKNLSPKQMLHILFENLREIHIISSDVFLSNLKERKILLAVLYYIVVPVSNLIFLSFIPIVQKGTGIAIFQAQLATTELIKTYFVSFFLGQILIALLTSDQIAGEVERGTFTLLRSKPLNDWSIALGKYLGMLYTLIMLILPVSILYFVSILGIYEADWPWTYIKSLDEIIAACVLIVLLLGVIVSLSILSSAVFNKSMHSIISTLLVLFVLSISGSALFGSNNYFSMSWYVDAIFPHFFYNLEPLKDAPNGSVLVLVLVAANIAIVGLSCIILMLKEDY